jgi:hypothetical protein
MEDSTKSLNLSLNLYSIFGYLLPGLFFTLLYIIDFDLSLIFREYSKGNIISLESLSDMPNVRTNLLLSYFSNGTFSDFKFIPFLIYLFLCYLLGHIISACSSLILERLLIKEFFGYPTALLVNAPNTGCIMRKCWMFKWLLKDFQKPFPKETINQIKTITNNVFNYNLPSRDYYWQCYSFVITSRPYLAPRVHHFVNLYGFSRNVAFSLFFYVTLRITILYCFLNVGIDKHSFLVLLILFFSGLFMFWNYTKLFKRQAVDVFTLFLSIIADNNLKSK